MTAAVLTLDPNIEATGSFDPAVSQAAGSLSEIVRADQPPTSMSLDAKRFDAKKALIELLADCSEPNWDGYGALPPNLVGIRRAWTLLSELPKDVPAPDLSIHPDGEVAFEWTGSDDAILTASFSDDAHIKWAAIVGGERLYGRLPYADSLPARLHRMVLEVIGPQRPKRRY